MTLRHAALVHHLGVGIDNAERKILLFVDETAVTVTDLDAGEVLALNNIDETRNYWRNELRAPGRWPAPT